MTSIKKRAYMMLSDFINESQEEKMIEKKCNPQEMQGFISNWVDIHFPFLDDEMTEEEREDVS